MDPKPTKDADLSSDQPPAKKAYAAPLLMRWGTLRDMTLSAGSTSPISDGAKTGSKRRTH